MDIWRRAAKLNRAGASGLDLAGASIESGRADHLPLPRMGLNRMVHSVLARLRPEHIRRNGAAVAVVEDALPSDYYEALATSFPSVEFIAGPGPLDNNRAYRKAAPEMIGRSETPPIWAEFLAYHSSRAFFDEFCDLWGEDIAGLHPALEENFGKPLRQFSVGVRGAGKRTDPTNQDHDLVLDCQVSINSPVTEGSSVRGPHLDSPRKLFNALLYFRHPDDRSTGGDLEFYRLKGGGRRRSGARLILIWSNGPTSFRTAPTPWSCSSTRGGPCMACRGDRSRPCRGATSISSASATVAGRLPSSRRRIAAIRGSGAACSNAGGDRRGAPG